MKPLEGPRTVAKEHPGEFLEALEEVTRGITDPVAKLRFIRSYLPEYRQVDRVVQKVPFRPARRMLYRWAGLEGLRQLMKRHGLASPADLTVGTRLSVAFGRAVTAVVALIVVGAMTGLSTFAYRYWRSRALPVTVAAEPAPPAPAPAPVLAPLVIPAGVAPAAVWLVEHGEGFEQYSNGLRIDTRHAVPGEPRKFHVFDRATGLVPVIHDRPAGILFHTSESDVWPLEEGFNDNLRLSSVQLLRWVKRHKLYHYLIDRFGRVYRVVEEESKANHAGHSVWAQGDRIHLNLNHSFLGVSFETRWEGGRALPITQAQFAAGRNLSDWLRGRWEIPAEMCVAHGLTSVNPKKHLIGHHLDWARGFPFEAFGLPDQYQLLPPSVELFGFAHDDDFLKVLGEPWAGVREAERALAREAARRGQTVDEVRRERQGLYDRWLTEQSRAETATAARDDPAASRKPGGVRGGA
ncbi:MAG TPA: peptidoglycan recognition family protein [Vicinamibacteria bacterium]|nr:peptidoglycan recognition family protein [Vicinamibacteria bacterium]